MLAFRGAPMNTSSLSRSRAATAPQLTLTAPPSASSIRKATCNLRSRLGRANGFFRAWSAVPNIAAVTQPSGHSSAAATASTTPANGATDPIPTPTTPATAQETVAEATVPPAALTDSAPKVNENFTGDMLKPSVFNTPFVRAASVLGAVAAVAGSTLLLPNTLGAFLHVTSYAVLLGTQLWNTFFVGITMFKNLPRQTFGKVQSKLFPQYFSLTAGANLLALITLALAGASATAAGVRALVALSVSLGGILVNWLGLEPICIKLMFQRYDIENQPEKTVADKERIATLYKEFGKWHGLSSVINLVSFCVAVVHGWFLASLLVVAA